MLFRDAGSLLPNLELREGKTMKRTPSQLKDDTHALSRKVAAELLGINVRSLDRWRAEGRGPAFLDLSIGKGKKSCIRYLYSDIIAFLESARIKPVLESEKEVYNG